MRVLFKSVVWIFFHPCSVGLSSVFEEKWYCNVSSPGFVYSVWFCFKIHRVCFGFFSNIFRSLYMLSIESCFSFISSQSVFFAFRHDLYSFFLQSFMASSDLVAKQGRFLQFESQKLRVESFSSDVWITRKPYNRWQKLSYRNYKLPQVLCALKKNNIPTCSWIETGHKLV